jgi:type III secretion protein V
MQARRANWSSDIAMVVGVAVILMLIVVPMPTSVIDVLLGINIGVSVLLLMVAMYTTNLVTLSSFPTLLLVTTVFRLGLNIASTKLILLHADAGHIIETFGNLVVGGNMVVGFVVFIVITLVQFIVIAKGSERVAEVGARFTLDAMPGKQMSIDADLRAGYINGDQARRRRGLLAMESQVHGGMDGAMKFVKGDAVAALVITVINVVGGIIVGILYHAMSAGEAASRFAILSIGDAMVSQIPSLLICLSAGVLITRVANDLDDKKRSLGQEIGHQMMGNPRALYLAAVVMLGFALIPGFPWHVFLLLAALSAYGGHRLSKNKGLTPIDAGDDGLPGLQRDGTSSDSPGLRDRPAVYSVPLAIRIAPGIAQAIRSDLLNRAFEDERARLQEELGLPFPGVRLWQSAECADNIYQILVHDVPLVSGTLLPGKLMVPSPSEQALALCEKVGEKAGPGGGETESHWIAKEQAGKLPKDAVAIEHEVVIARHAIAVLRQHGNLFLGIPEVQWLMDKLSADYGTLVAEVQKVVPMQRVTEVLRRLLEEQVPIRSLRTIFESLITWAPREKDILMLTEYVRIDLTRMLTHRATGGQPTLSAVLLDSALETLVRQSIKATPTGNFLAMTPEQMKAISDKIAAATGEQPRSNVAVVTALDVRRYVRRIIEGRLRWLQVYSFNELGPDLQIEPLARIAA